MGCWGSRILGCRDGPRHLARTLQNAGQAIIAMQHEPVQLVVGRRGSKGRNDCWLPHLDHGPMQEILFASWTPDNYTPFVPPRTGPWPSLLQGIIPSTLGVEQTYRIRSWVSLYRYISVLGKCSAVNISPVIKTRSSKSGERDNHRWGRGQSRLQSDFNGTMLPFAWLAWIKSIINPQRAQRIID